MKAILLFLLFMLINFISKAQNLTWAKQLAGSGINYGNDVVVDAQGNVYTTGYFNGTVDFDPGPGVFNLSQPTGAGAYISKLDANGDFVWAKQFEGWNIVSFAISLDATGNIYTTGFFQQFADFDPGPGVYNMTNVLGADVFICKLNNNGDFIWAKQFGGVNNIYLGSYDIVIDGSGNAIITGHFNGTADFDPGSGTFNLTPVGLEDIFIAKLDINGDFIWAKKMSGTSFEQGQSIAVDGANNIYTTGYFSGTVDFDPGAGTFNMSATNNNDIYISKIDQNGSFIWAKQLSGSSQALAQSIKLNSVGEIILTGYFRNIIDLDPGSGTFNLTSIAGSIDLFLLKLDASGNFLWGKQIGSNGVDRGFKLSIDAINNIYITGGFENTVDFDPGPSVFNLVSFGSEDAFVCKLDNAGNFIWAKQIGGPGVDISFSIVSDALENIFSTGLFTQTADFDPGLAVYNLVSAGFEDGFILKLSRCVGVTSSILNITACTSYTLNNQTYTTSGTYFQTLLNVAGCDSIITLNLILGGSSTTISVVACDNYFWEGQTYTSSGLLSVTYIDAYGCDSIRNLNLTINNSISTSSNAVICEGQTYEGYSVSGIYTDNFIAANGCDSIRTLTLTVKQKSFGTINASICEGQFLEGYSSSGTYIDTYIGANGCDSIRTLNLLVNPKKNTFVNTTICEGQFLFVGGQNQTITGLYKDTLLTSLGCDSIISTNLKVNPKPQPNLGNDISLCIGNSATFSPGSFNSYLWQDLSISQTFTTSSTGRYWVTVTDNNNCSATDTVSINAINLLPANFLKPVDSVCSYEKLLLQPLRNYSAYEWSTGSANKNIVTQTPGYYWLKVVDNNGCIGVDTILVLTKNCPTGIFIPTAFTPNNDGKNDLFKPIVYGQLEKYNFTVYNRWGQVVFKSSIPGQGWDGKFEGKQQDSHVFIWTCTYQFIAESVNFKKGTVVLIR